MYLYQELFSQKTTTNGKQLFLYHFIIKNTLNLFIIDKNI
ncbi:hypothetical protein D932_01175 [Enterococcus casseliflavus 14-MB-W-14]|nr:hypothetical protein D932_01175 [Enterococcus casseliflavus 14-MB-W-14]